jgi:hypothetical protein
MDITFQQLSSPYERPENPTNIVDLLDFLACPPMNFIGSETLWLTLIYQPRW